MGRGRPGRLQQWGLGVLEVLLRFSSSFCFLSLSKKNSNLSAKMICLER